MWSFSKSIFYAVRRPVFAYLFTLSMTAIAVCSLLMYLIEHPHNAEIKNLLDAFYYSVTIMTGVGLGDIAPLTTAGKILSMLMMLLGTAIFVCFTAVLGVTIMETEMDHQKSQRRD